ncbi:NAD-dependent epimerase/dehydratase family protein [Croceibacterium aestuarii]|uniref:NAD-dependent epimerase/dehydratase family protein n=1 Tax=Croceibacterium aestuarii TaxID=3064139 RepID=UPI00272ECD23|nr:NAD(P)-dependent oxidoreductase [Croceibacterium sp. D39]
MTIAVTGATGFVGHALLEEAARADLPIRALTRREQPPASGVEWVHGDLGDRDALAKLVAGAEAVIHVAGVVNAPEPDGFHLGNVEGTMKLVEQSVAEGVPRFVFVSSLAAREPQLSRYGESKRHAERLVMASGLDWSIVRPPAIYGPHDREMLDMFRAARWGVLPMPPPGRASVIHVRDLARLLLALVPGGEEVTHKAFEPDDGRPGGWSHRDLARAIGAAVGRRPWVPHLSKAALERLAKLDATLRRNKAKLTPDRVGYMAHPDWVSSPKLHPPRQLWQPEIPTRTGMKATAEWYRRQGWL